MNKKILLHQKIFLTFFGLFLTAVILEIILRIGGFTILSLQEHRNLQSIKQKGSCRIMCLGESTTQNQYPPYLEEILNQRNIGIKFSVIDKGIVGTNTTVILSQLEANIDKYQPDIVITMMGSNDSKGIMYYKDIHEADTWLFQHCRAYRFIRIVHMHILNKLNKKDIYGLHSLNFNREFLEREEAFKKAIELNPKNDSAYVELGRLYRDRGKLTESEQTYKKAIELNPKDDSTWVLLGCLYRNQGKLAELEQAFKKAIELNPKNDSAYVELGRLYGNQGKLSESEQILKKAIELNPGNDSLYGGLATIYYEIGNDELSSIYAKKTDSLRDEYSNPKTINNYHILKHILDKRKIRLVCMQYPMRNIAPLKKIFREEAEGSIIFVDNERIFKEAIRKESYKEYFKDMFGGDFGHCTDKGNKLLAENIANAIFKKIFHK